MFESVQENSSLVSFIGVTSNNSCGYCKKKTSANNPSTVTDLSNSILSVDSNNDELFALKKSSNFGVIAHLISSKIFNQFLELGWSRSGRYLYKPIMIETCCPQYTIRLDINKFKISRTQKRVMKTIYNYLKYDQVPSKKFIKQNTLSVSKIDPCVKFITKSDICSILRLKPKQSTEKKKTLRRRRAEEKLLNLGINLEEYKIKRKLKEESRKRSLESFFADFSKGEWKHVLETRLIHINSAEFYNTFNESYLIYKKYQLIIHDDNDVDEDKFKRFLSSSPLVDEPDTNDNIKPKLGSFHQQYILDGKIIAVGVIDILPRCLSSKYLFYDPDYKFLSIGTYSALNEIKFTKELSIKRPDLHYYYMGFYVYNCPKMQYKGKFYPSDLLCDKTFEWVSLAECEKMLAANNSKFTVFKPQSDILLPIVNVEKIRLLLDTNTAIKFGMFRQHFRIPEKLAEDLQFYTIIAGPISTEILLFYPNLISNNC